MVLRDSLSRRGDGALDAWALRSFLLLPELLSYVGPSLSLGSNEEDRKLYHFPPSLAWRGIFWSMVFISLLCYPAWASGSGC